MFLIKILEKLLKIWKDHKMLLHYCQLTCSGKVLSLKLRDHLSSASPATNKLYAFRKVSSPFWPSSVKWEDWLTQSFKNFPMLILYKLSSSISPIAEIPRNSKLFSRNNTRKPECPRELLGYCRWIIWGLGDTKWTGRWQPGAGATEELGFIIGDKRRLASS